MDDREHQYDLLTAAVLGLTLGVGATLLLRRGPTGRRPISPALMGMAKGAAWAGRGAARMGAKGGRWARKRGGELWDHVPVDAMQAQVEDYLGRARDTIDDAVTSELRDLRRAMRRQRRRLGI